MLKKWWQSVRNSRNLSNLLVLMAAILFYSILHNIKAVGDFFESVYNVIAPFFWGAVIAYLLNPIDAFFEKKVFGFLKNRKTAGRLSVCVTFVLALGALAMLIWAIIPQLGSSMQTLFGNLEGYFSMAKRTLHRLLDRFRIQNLDVDTLLGTWEELFTKLSNLVVENIGNILSTSYKVGSGLFQFALSAIFSVYILLDKRNLRHTANRLGKALFAEEKRARRREVLSKANSIVLSYLGGNLIDSLIVGVANYLFMLIMGMPYSLLISVIVAVTNFIPTFGPVIGAVPSALILLLVNPIQALWFLVFTVVIQLLDSNLIKPLLFSDSTGLRPLWVLVAIIVGGRLMGVLGMLIGIPVFAFLSYLLEEALVARLAAKNLNPEGEPIREGELPTPGTEQPPKPSQLHKLRVWLNTEIGRKKEK